MKTLTLSVASREEVAARANAAAGGEPQGAFVNFTSAEFLLRIVTPHRLNLIRALIGQGTLSVGELATRLGLDARAVDAEIQALANAGLVELGPQGAQFDYDELHVDFRV
ncbi:HVO_A0114 family putative DNA-binding protein (plasmid) [Limimaricola litoreus]|nr:helix-turn-helix domain-containing protein [Limimaricola litoreus]